ncbi:adenylate cyclase [Tritrichomonas foetus]|uniref:Adenylate cyclase n=1 Tax=Tritrichomonas foetus TaxID=1144522 RepID=A0A1J4KSE6_9EUKA|nr:adenylate cyclase [Tritrichomonas foetus]|eukprot:OHT13808.1 adenylate cyclase [Tritrichomonas foetus]
MYHILPRTIVVKLNQGEKDISFTVSCATIMFIDIVKFSEFTAQLTPQAIMAALSGIFCAYDDLIEEYSEMLKIKLIGDVYMCAAGLFSDSDKPQIHADQSVKFGLDALQILEDINLKANTMLNIRIGVNTGGPLIAGVLGTDKPVFDIIGDPINVASRLQSTDVPGAVQVSKTTYELLDNIEYHAELRDDVYLKGKGKTQAYLIYPKSRLQFQLSSGIDAS